MVTPANMLILRIFAQYAMWAFSGSQEKMLKLKFKGPYKKLGLVSVAKISSSVLHMQ
jgi:hypothetical protein